MATVKRAKTSVVKIVDAVEEQGETSITSPEALLQQMAIVDNILSDVRKTLDAFYKDKGVPIDIKREVYLKTPFSLEKSSDYIVHLPIFETIHRSEQGRAFSWNDYFYREKHEKVELKEVCLDLIENGGDGDYVMDWSPALREAFINDSVTSGFHSFYMDW